MIRVKPNLLHHLLYNLLTYQGESNNLAAQNPEVVQQMLRLAEEMRNELGK